MISARSLVEMCCIGNAIEVLVNGILTHREVTTTSLSGASAGIQANAGANTFYDDFIEVLPNPTARPARAFFCP